MTKSDKKAKEYYTTNKIFPIQQTIDTEFWVVEGITGLHNVRYDKKKDVWACTCKNVRNTFCSHIKGVILYKNDSDKHGKTI
jgi:hypothetical protein